MGTIPKVVDCIDHSAIVAMISGVCLRFGKCFANFNAALKAAPANCVKVRCCVKAKLFVLVCKGHWFFLVFAVALFEQVAASKLMEQEGKNA